MVKGIVSRISVRHDPRSGVGIETVLMLVGDKQVYTGAVSEDGQVAGSQRPAWSTIQLTKVGDEIEFKYRTDFVNTLSKFRNHTLDAERQ